MYLLHSVTEMKSRKKTVSPPDIQSPLRKQGGESVEAGAPCILTEVRAPGLSRTEEDTHARWEACRMEVGVVFLKCIAVVCAG